MKRIFIIITLMFAATLVAQAQLYVPGETLHYRMSYKAKLFPNTEVAKVVMQTTEATLDGMPVYKVYGYGETAKAFSWVLPVKDAYTVWVDPATLRTKRFDSDLHEGDYTFRSTYLFDWANHKDEEIKEGFAKDLEMVLEDTVRYLRFRFDGREVKKVRGLGKFNTLRFRCKIATSTATAFRDGTEFIVWISDDRNKIPLYIESPIKVGSVCAYLSSYEGLRYPLDCFVKK